MTPPPAPARGYVRGETTVHTDPARLAQTTAALRATGRRIVFVPTMGALHEGHLRLVEQAQRVPGSVVVVSIFVNPLQFNDAADLSAYPRTLESDVAALREAGVELVFAPTAEAMYPHGQRTLITPGPTGERLEGESRPGHFAGMLTVVAKLLQLVGPEQAFFGEKDYQQLVLIRELVEDLHLGVRVVGVPTVREPDGLALSSRNVRIAAEAREAAAGLYAALVAGAYNAQSGVGGILDAARATLEAPGVAGTVEVEYLECTAPDLGAPPEVGDGRLLIAARVPAADGGTVRLIDNVGVAIGTGFLAKAEEECAAEAEVLRGEAKQ